MTYFFSLYVDVVLLEDMSSTNIDFCVPLPFEEVLN